MLSSDIYISEIPKKIIANWDSPTAPPTSEKKNYKKYFKGQGKNKKIKIKNKK